MAAKGKKSDEGTLDVTVFVPKGQARAGDIKKAALLAADAQIPMAAFVDSVEIDEKGVSEPKTTDGKDGRDYTVKISFRARRTTDDPEAATVAKVLTSLEPLTPEKLAEVTGTAAEA